MITQTAGYRPLAYPSPEAVQTTGTIAHPDFLQKNTVIGGLQMISISHNWLFIHIPRTGGNSVQSVLALYSEDRHTRNVFERHPIDKCLSHFAMLLNSPFHQKEGGPLRGNNI
jgi:hypothetical protein